MYRNFFCPPKCCNYRGKNAPMSNRPNNNDSAQNYASTSKDTEMPSDDCKEKRILQNISMKNASFGEIIIPEDTEKGTTYLLSTISLNTSDCSRFLVRLDFTCNIITINSGISMRVQILKQMKDHITLLPVSPGLYFSKNTKDAEANTLSLCAIDDDSLKSEICSYIVQLTILERNTEGITTIVNPSLVSCLVLCPVSN